jgi:phospholipase C
MAPSNTLRTATSKLMWVGALVGGLLVSLSLTLVAFPEHSAQGATSPIQHVVIIDMENHSFDNVLGQLCIQDNRHNADGYKCDAVSQGDLSNGQTIQLSKADDLVPSVAHDNAAQDTAINGGKMNGFDKISGCHSDGGYRCYSQFSPDQIPNTAALARQFAISDHTFEQHSIPSWGSHMILAASQLDKFRGNNPQAASGVTPGPGWGCNSNKVAQWRASPQDSWQLEPSCIPKQDGSGPFRASPVTWVPTIFDRMEAANLGWKIYTENPSGTGGNAAKGTGYIWTMCPYFADCLSNPAQASNMVLTSNLKADAQSCKAPPEGSCSFPNVSFVIPKDDESQHNGFSMKVGEDWINSIITPLMSNQTLWNHTAIFLMQDDCGCFYDHVPPPAHTPKLGIRIPMIIISPYARPGYTDNKVASMSSPLAYIEHNFGLDPLSSADRDAYDYSNSFDYTRSPSGPVQLSSQTIPKKERDYIRTHPVHDSEM